MGKEAGNAMALCLLEKRWFQQTSSSFGHFPPSKKSEKTGKLLVEVARAGVYQYIPENIGRSVG